MTRPIKPTALKLLQGTTRPDRINFNEPTPDVSIPAMPAFLGGEAAVEWERVTLQLHAIGMIAHVDMALLAVYCQAWADFCAAVVDIRKRGYVINGAHGGKRRNPMLTVKQQAAEILLQTAAHFGLSPATRAKMIAPNRHTKDPFEEFLASG